LYFSVRVSILHPPDTPLTHADRLDHDFLPSHLRARRSRAHPPSAPNTAHSRRSVPCMTGGSEGSIGLLVAQPSSLFAHPASQPPGAQTAPQRPTRPRKLSTYMPDTTKRRSGTPYHHASASRLRLRGSYGTIEWMMRMESSPMYMTLGIGISSQLLCIMP
jgi:hypothetical protein